MGALLAACALPASARADVELDPATDTVRVAGRLDGALTRPAGGAAAPIGLEYVRKHRSALGLTLGDLDTLAPPTVRSANGIRQVRWRQAVDGVPVADAELRVNVDADGRVINVLGSPASGLPEDTTPRLPEPQPDAELTIYDGRLAYRYQDEAAPDAIYDTISDADTGKVLKRTNLVKSAVPANVWDKHPTNTPAQSVDLEPWLSTTARLEGPYVHAYADVNGTDAVTNVTPGAYPFVSVFDPPGIGCTAVKPCSWNGQSTTTAVNRNQTTVQAFYLANRFRDHLAEDPIGFDGFSGVDKIKLETGNGSARNNANMFTPPEGQAPRMQMYLWSGDGYRSVNSADDASILFHEYAHGLSGRLVVDAEGVQALGSWQAAAMGEGWSDFYAKDYLVAEGLETDTPAPGEIDMGTYVDAMPHSMRRAALDCPVGSTCPGGGFTYADFADGGPQVHDDGEIWAQTLWDLRTAMADRDATLAIVTQAMRLSPPEPSFLDMRNAILQADTALFGSSHHPTIWTVFANRGMGFYASTVDGADVNPVANTAMPPSGGPRGTLTGSVTDLGAGVEGAEVRIGDRVATTAADGRYTLADLPALTYEHVVVTAPGFDRRVLDDVTVPGTADAELRRNWASVGGGATVTLTGAGGGENAPIGCGPKQAVDGLQASTWSTVQGVDKPMVIKLPTVVHITSLAIDPTAGCGDLGGSSMGQYAVEVGTGANGPWTQIAAGVFGPVHRNRLNPVAATATGAEYVRLTPMTTQTPGADYIDVSEFAVYGTPGFEARILSGPTGPVAQATFTFTGFGTTSFECRVDGEAFAPCESPVMLTGADGEHRFEVQGVSGGQRTAIVGRDFTINTKLPETSFTSTPPALTNAASVAFGFAGGPSFECSLDGAAFSACTSGQRWTVGDGAHRFAVRSVNNAGPDATPAVHDFTVDTTPPDTVITWGPPPVLTTREFSVAFAASESGATFLCSVDGAAAAPCTSPLPLGGLGDGAHSVVVTAIDAAGNVDPTPARSDFTVVVPGVAPAPPSPTPTATPTVTPKRAALTSAKVPKTVSRRTGKVKVTLRGVRGAKVSVQARRGSRVVGKASRTLTGSSLSLQLKLDRRRLKTGATVTVVVKGSGSGLTTVTRTLRFRLKA